MAARVQRPLELFCDVGALDSNPEQFITFRGIVPIPVGTRGHKRLRAEVTIRFFELDTREVLLTERARSVFTLHLAISALDNSDPSTARVANSTINQLTDIRSPHANCSRAFHDLWLNNRVLATEFAEAAADYLDSL